jgi:hypothetical protein
MLRHYNFYVYAKTRARYIAPLQLDFADLDGREILTVAARDLVLIALLELEHGDFLGAALRDDLAAHAGFGSAITEDDFLFVSVDGENLAKRHVFADFARDTLDTNSVARRDAVLLTPGLNNGVHLPSKL